MEAFYEKNNFVINQCRRINGRRSSSNCIGLQNLFFPIGLAFIGLILVISRDQAFISFLKPDDSQQLAEGQES